MADEPTNPVCLYLTKEQAARVAALTIDSLVGCQVHGDANDETYVFIDMVPIDSVQTSEHYRIHADGSYTRTT